MSNYLVNPERSGKLEITKNGTAYPKKIGVALRLQGDSRIGSCLDNLYREGYLSRTYSSKSKQ